VWEGIKNMHVGGVLWCCFRYRFFTLDNSWLLSDIEYQQKKIVILNIKLKERVGKNFFN